MTALPPIPKFPEVDQADARGELGEIYADIRFTLRAPWVPFAIRVMSLFPAFVPAAWQMLKPQISTVYAEKGADLVREASIIPGPLPPDPRPKLRAAGRSEEEISKIRQALDSLNYGYPKGLILKRSLPGPRIDPLGLCSVPEIMTGIRHSDAQAASRAASMGWIALPP